MRSARLLPVLFWIFFLAPRTGAAQESYVPTGGAALVQPGDQVRLRIEREPEMSDTFHVDMNGEVVLPRLGSVKVADQTAESLQEFLRGAYARYLRDPSIEITLLRRVSVHGDVYRPGLYMVDLTMSLPDLLALAGGPTEAGDLRKIEILRGERRLRLHGLSAMDLPVAELRSGDRVIVGRKNWLARNPHAAIGTFSGLVGVLLYATQVLGIP